MFKHRSNGHDMNVEEVWEQDVTGRGAVVSILDDGIEHNHPDLRENYVSYSIQWYVDVWITMPRILMPVTISIIMMMIRFPDMILLMRTSMAQGVLVKWLLEKEVIVE